MTKATSSTDDGRRWPRPVPLIGDTTSARERANHPSGWAMSPETRMALHEVIDARRDVRRYRPDPVPDEVLRRVLTAAHHGPSVGHSQPWRFLVVTDPVIRDHAAVMADRERLRQAREIEPDAARRLLDLQLEGIREAPLGVVVCCDRRTPATGVLGRATFPDTDLWSCACAIQNMWLAARAEGLGMGWVTLFSPEDLHLLLELPDGVETLGWLCLGWPDERPPEPGLVRAGWSKRLPLSEVVLRDRWPSDTPSPAPPVSHLRAPAPARVVDVRDQADELLTTPGSLGVLDRYLDRVLALNHPHSDRATLILVGADHPVTTHRVSAYDPSITRDVLAAAHAGRSLGAALASAAGIDVTVIDAGINGPAIPGVIRTAATRQRGDLVQAPALHAADARSLLAAGQTIGESAARSYGIIALGEVGIGNTTIAAALAALMLDLDPHAVVGLGSGSDTAMLDRKRIVVTKALARARAARDISDPISGLSELGGPEIAILAGLILGAAHAHATVVLDGLAVSVAALIATRLEPAAQANTIAGQRSRENAHALVLADLGLEPLLDLRLRAGEGAGAILATQTLTTALRARTTLARVH